jgi:LysM repeat protein
MMRKNRLIALCLLLVLMSFSVLSVFAQDEATEEATAEVTAEATSEATAEATEAVTATPTTQGGTYTVQVGDNLFRIALRYGLTTRQLAEANGITNPALIYVGQRLVIPGTSGTLPTATPVPATTSQPTVAPTATSGGQTSNTYVVQVGDTLFRIASRNGTTITELLRVNPSITNQNNIFVGQRINLPGGTTSTGATPTPATTTDGGTTTTLDLTLLTGVEVFLGDDLNAISSQVTQLGVDTVKFTVDWREVEATEGTLVFDTVDAAVDAFDAAGLNIIITLIGSPAWAVPDATELALAQNALIPPADLNDFGTFAGAVASRYAGRVDGYEIWTDPNLRTNWMIANVTQRPDGFPDARLAVEVRYIDLLEAAHTAIKAADANAQVITAGLAPTGNNDFYNSIDTFVFFEALLSQGALNFSDGIGVHVDGFSNAPDAECCGTIEDGIAFNESYYFFFNTMLDNYREILDRNGGEATPLVVTRVGWGSADNASTAPRADVSYLSDNTAAEQAQFTVAAFALAAERGDVGSMILYNLNGCAVENAQACYYSVIGADGSARPLFTEIQNLDLSAAVEPTEAVAPEATAEVAPEATDAVAPEATEESGG